MKLCINCKYYFRYKGIDFCTFRDDLSFCSRQRKFKKEEDRNKCGIEGTFYSRKWWKFWAEK